MTTPQTSRPIDVGDPWHDLHGKTVVIKYGGAAMREEQLRDSFAQDIVRLTDASVKVVIVHGGGKEVSRVADRLGIESRFIDGQRYTDDAMMEVVQMVLVGTTNKDLVARINKKGGNALGLCGMDSNLLTARRYQKATADLGRVGEIEAVNAHILHHLLAMRITPIIAPVAADSGGQTLNINADLAATGIARAMTADALVFLSDVEGVMHDGRVLKYLPADRVEDLIGMGIISGGMIPKLRSAVEALDEGVHGVHIANGCIPYAATAALLHLSSGGTRIAARHHFVQEEVML